MKFIIFVITVFSIFLVNGCKAPGCEDLSWGETELSGMIKPEVTYSAGARCDNYSDYFDGNISSVIKKIKSLKLTIVEKKCEEYQGDDIVEIECPEFIEGQIVVKELTGCKFETPPDANTDCEQGPLELIYETSSEYFKNFVFVFNDPNNLNFYKEFSDIPNSENIESVAYGMLSLYMQSYDGSVSIIGYFSTEDLSTVRIWFKTKTDQHYNFEYKVEMSE